MALPIFLLTSQQGGRHARHWIRLPLQGQSQLRFLAGRCGHQYTTVPIQLSNPQGMVANEEKERTGIHVTSLLNCLRKVVLDQRHDLYISSA